MNFKVFKACFKELKTPSIITLSFVIVSSLLIFISTINSYFLFVSIPILLISLYLIKLLFIQYYKEYDNNSKNEKFARNGLFKGVKNEFINYNKKQYKYTSDIVNGKRNGNYTEYYDSGKIKFQTKYINGSQSGDAISYYENGIIYRKANISNGIYIGDTIEYFNSGKIKFIINKMNYKFFDQEENIRCEINGSFDGMVSINRKLYFIPTDSWRSYNSKGNLEYELKILNPIINSDDVFNAKKITYSEKGEIIKEEEKQLKLKHGFYVNFHNDFTHIRLNSTTFMYDNGMMGPPGIYKSYELKLKPITSLADIVDYI